MKIKKKKKNENEKRKICIKKKRIKSWRLDFYEITKIILFNQNFYYENTEFRELKALIQGPPFNRVTERRKTNHPRLCSQIFFYCILAMILTVESLSWISSFYFIIFSETCCPPCSALNGCAESDHSDRIYPDCLPCSPEASDFPLRGPLVYLHAHSNWKWSHHFPNMGW